MILGGRSSSLGSLGAQLGTITLLILTLPAVPQIDGAQIAMSLSVDPAVRVSGWTGVKVDP